MWPPPPFASQKSLGGLVGIDLVELLLIGGACVWVGSDGLGGASVMGGLTLVITYKLHLYVGGGAALVW